MNEALAVLQPNRVVSKTALRLLIFGQLMLFLAFWGLGTASVIPKPWEVLGALGDLWSDGIVEQLMVSLALYAEALLLATAWSLAISYAASMTFFRPIADGWSKLRFLGMVGLPFLFTLYLSGAHQLKLALLAFSISVFMVTSMLDVLAGIPREKYDLARTLRMGEWRVVWEVMVLGRIDFAFDVMRQNAAIGWMMLGMVEGLFRSEGGIGTVLMTQDKHFHLAAVAAIQVAILGLGLAQDYAIGVVKQIVCPYASMLLERR
jgi:NitT/TauT family transport system permease protein